eukprot:357798-Chlamydomonas_euryale.AAC.17
MQGAAAAATQATWSAGGPGGARGEGDGGASLEVCSHGDGECCVAVRRTAPFVRQPRKEPCGDVAQGASAAPLEHGAAAGAAGGVAGTGPVRDARCAAAASVPMSDVGAAAADGGGAAAAVLLPARRDEPPREVWMARGVDRRGDAGLLRTAASVLSLPGVGALWCHGRVGRTSARVLLPHELAAEAVATAAEAATAVAAAEAAAVAAAKAEAEGVQAAGAPAEHAHTRSADDDSSADVAGAPAAPALMGTVAGDAGSAGMPAVSISGSAPGVPAEAAATPAPATATTGEPSLYSSAETVCQSEPHGLRPPRAQSSRSPPGHAGGGPAQVNVRASFLAGFPVFGDALLTRCRASIAQVGLRLPFPLPATPLALNLAWSRGGLLACCASLGDIISQICTDNS